MTATLTRPACVLAVAISLAPLASVLACGSGPIPIAQDPSAPTQAPAAPTGAAPVSSAPPPVIHHGHEPEDLDPSLATARAPELFLADFTTTRGDFVVEVHRAWAPNAADRFYNLVKLGFFDDSRFYRAVPDFMVQFGISGDPRVSAKWRNASFADDPVVESNLRGFVSFARTGQPNSSVTQMFISYVNHARLDASGFAPFGKVTRGMEIVDDLYKGYGESPPGGKGPDQERVENEGNPYLDRDFPKLDRILFARIGLEGRKH